MVRCVFEPDNSLLFGLGEVSLLLLVGVECSLELRDDVVEVGLDDFDLVLLEKLFDDFPQLGYRLFPQFFFKAVQAILKDEKVILI